MDGQKSGNPDTSRRQRDTEASWGCKTIQLTAEKAQSTAQVILHFLELFSTVYMMSCISQSLIWRHNISHKHILDHEARQPYFQDVATASIARK